MNILVLGGTRFFGIHLVESLLEQGHAVTVATRGTHSDPFGTRVERVHIDHTDDKSMTIALAGKRFDTVCDNICYCSNDIHILLEAVKAQRYVVTSSGAVYDLRHDQMETDFSPTASPVVWSIRSEFDYGTGKRHMEEALFQTCPSSAAAVRFPYVIGEDDYTNRLRFYVEHVVQEKPMHIDNPDASLSFVSSNEAGRFLAWLAVHPECTGPVNGANHGTVCIREILRYAEEKAGRHAILSPDGDPAPYNGTPDYTLNTTRAKEWGFSFKPLESYFYTLLDLYLND